MPVQVMLAASLRKYVPGYDGAVGHSLEIQRGETVLHVARKLEIPPEEVKLIMVNGIGSTWDKVLEGDERVAFFPPVGGG